MKFKLFACGCVTLSLNLMASMVNAQGSTVKAAPSPATTALVQANNRFAIDIFQKVSPQATENAFLSPYSLSSALAMTWAGARADTADQMAKALHLAEVPAGDATHDFTALNAALAEAQTASGAQLSVANSLWPEQNPENPFLPEYITSVEKDFAAGLFPVDYQASLRGGAAEDQPMGRGQDAGQNHELAASRRRNGAGKAGTGQCNLLQRPVGDAV